jgi:carbamate kinase
MATDADAVFLDWGTPKQRGIHQANPVELQKHKFPAGSMGPKVEAACQFALATGKTAAIGALADLPGILRGAKGTLVSRDFSGLSYHP